VKESTKYEYESEYREIIERAWSAPELRKQTRTLEAVASVWEALDQGKLRVAEPLSDEAGAEWKVNVWVKEAILLYFASEEPVPLQVGIFHYRDKVPLKKDPEGAGVRVVPPATIRYGSFLEPGIIAMPSYVNVGAYVGANTMIDTWATVGSCAQVGRNVHVSGGGAR